MKIARYTAYVAFEVDDQSSNMPLIIRGSAALDAPRKYRVLREFLPDRGPNRYKFDDGLELDGNATEARVRAHGLRARLSLGELRVVQRHAQSGAAVAGVEATGGG